MENKLKPCPFCGSDAKREIGCDISGNFYCFWAKVRCTKCGCHVLTSESISHNYPIDANDLESLIKSASAKWETRYTDGQ
jgi:hypothetical protein